MVSIRTRALLSTFALVFGALLVGEALHGSVTTNQYPLTSPAAVLRIVAGALFLLVGYRLKVPIEEYTSASEPSSEESEEADAADTADAASVTADYDPSLSPLGDTAPGESDRERDESASEQDDDASGHEEAATEQDDDASGHEESTAEQDDDRERSG